MTLLQDPDQIQADTPPVMIHIQDPDFNPLPGPQCQAAAPLADGQLVGGDVAFVNESWTADADIDERAEQSSVFHPARQHGTHPQVAHWHDALFEICLPKIWGRQKEREREREDRWRYDGPHCCAGNSPYEASTDILHNGQWMVTHRRGWLQPKKPTYCVSSSKPTPVSAYFCSSQHSILHHFPLGLFQGAIVSLFCSIKTNKVCTPGNSPVQLSSPQHWFHAVASAHLFTQLSSDKEAGCSALQPNSGNLKMNLEGMFPNFEKRAPIWYSLFVCPHETEWKKERPQLKHRPYYLSYDPQFINLHQIFYKISLCF